MFREGSGPCGEGRRTEGGAWCCSSWRCPRAWFWSRERERGPGGSGADRPAVAAGGEGGGGVRVALLQAHLLLLKPLRLLPSPERPRAPHWWTCLTTPRLLPTMFPSPHPSPRLSPPLPPLPSPWTRFWMTSWSLPCRPLTPSPRPQFLLSPPSLLPCPRRTSPRRRTPEPRLLQTHAANAPPHLESADAIYRGACMLREEKRR